MQEMFTLFLLNSEQHHSFLKLRLVEMLLVHVEVGRNIKNVVGKILPVGYSLPLHTTTV